MTDKLDNVAFARHMRQRRGEPPARKQSGTIFTFSLHPTGSEGNCIALSECGVILAEHHCSDEAWGFRDLADGAVAGRYAGYAAFYPEGYILQAVLAAERGTNLEWRWACRRFVERSRDGGRLGIAMRLNQLLEQSRGSL